MVLKVKFFIIFFFLFSTIGLSQIVIKENPLNLGTIEEGTVISNCFIISNSSDSIFLISGVKPTCGCTFAKIEDKRLLPHQKTKLKFAFNSKHYKGHIRRKIYLFSNSKKFDLFFEADVNPLIKLSQDRIDLGFVNKNEVIDYDMFLSFSDKVSNIFIQKIEYNKNFIKIEYKKDKKNNLFNIKLVLSPVFINSDVIHEFVMFYVIYNGQLRRLPLRISGKIRK